MRRLTPSTTTKSLPAPCIFVKLSRIAVPTDCFHYTCSQFGSGELEAPETSPSSRRKPARPAQHVVDPAQPAVAEIAEVGSNIPQARSAWHRRFDAEPAEVAVARVHGRARPGPPTAKCNAQGDGYVALGPDPVGRMQREVHALARVQRQDP